MNMDDLERIFWNDVREQPVQVRLRRVVEALRDEIAPMSMIGVNYDIPELRDLFNDILGDAGEKAAGGPTREDGPDVVISSVQAPAADPSEVCVWIADGYRNLDGTMWVDCEGLRRWLKSRTACPSCGKPIAFKEAK